MLLASMWPADQQTLYLLLGDLFAQLCLLAAAALAARLLLAGESDGIL
jgi:hypothetical protein